MSRRETITLVLLILCAFAVRLYKIDSPVADWHSWRQADTVAVSRNFVKYGFDLLLPRYDDISSTQSGYFNPKGLRLVEFPLYNALVGILFLAFGVNEMYARLVSAVCSILSLLALYLLVRPRLGQMGALFASGLFAFLPYNIYFSRAIFPENMALSFAMLALVTVDHWSRVPQKMWLVVCAGFLASLALLTKVTSAFVLLPLAYLTWKTLRWKITHSVWIWVSASIVVIPILLWRWWISQFPEGVPANIWLLNGGNIRFKGAWFRWIFAERLSKMILGYGALPLFVNGVIARIRNPEDWLFVWMLVGSLLYMVVFARGNIQHDYYQILIIPSVAALAAKGACWMLNPTERFSQRVTIPALFVLLAFAWAFGWYEIRGNYHINHPEIVEAGKVVDRLAAQDALVIAPYDGDTAFLYQTNRAGWPILEGSIEDLIKKGADVYVSVRKDDVTAKVATRFATLAQTDQYTVIDLHRPAP